ncbi:protein of unknown function [Aquimarina amphilecti]|uniref:DUF4386 domain-containing protein n=2 Tax=Aquimarina amphilecti TaxID=1038014 RepID=A0A1H7QKH9_AQUAM|nr:protein of unknown function [Aquimarina amphilecti]
MISMKKDARVSGLLYILMIICGMFSLVYIPSKLYALDNALETHNNITTNELLFKIGILSDLCMITIFIFLSLSLYKLLKQVNNKAAIIMVVLVLVSVAFSYINLIPKLDIISLINNKVGINTTDIQAEKLLILLRSHYNGFSIVQIFWGLWLLPFGYLVLKSGFIPKIFGILLIVGCFGYLTDFLGYFLYPDSYGKTIIPTIASLPHALGEIGIGLWLLIIGVKKKSS